MAFTLLSKQLLRGLTYKAWHVGSTNYSTVVTAEVKNLGVIGAGQMVPAFAIMQEMVASLLRVRA